MLETKLEFDYVMTEQAHKAPVIVVAAGSSSRMQGANKQFLQLGAVPVIVRTLKAFENCEFISNIILVAREEDLLAMQILCEQHNITKVCDIVGGGSNRQESVLNGIKSLPKSCEKVLIHDGARPFVSGKIIVSVIKTLENFSACVPAVKVKDTIKQIDKDGKVIKTVPREDLVAIQTPQGVRCADYLKALEGIQVGAFTDDAAIMEAAGYTVATVEGSYNNIKITTKEDIVLANAILSEEEEW